MAKENFSVLLDDIVEFFEKRVAETSIPVDVVFKHLGNTKQKKLISITKIPDQYAALMKATMLVQINTLMYDSFINDEDIIKILFDQELNKITYNPSKCTIKLGQADIKTWRGIVNKYTFEPVDRAIECEQAFVKQTEEKAKEEKAAQNAAKGNGKKGRPRK